MKKRILRISGGLLAIAAILVGIFNYYIKPKYVTPLVIAVEEFLLEDSETVELLLQEYEKNLPEEVELDKEGEDNKDSKVSKVSNQVDQTLDYSSEEAPKTTEYNKKKVDQGTKKNTIIAGKTMAELQAEVEPSDLKAGLKIATKIDTGHLLGLAKGGLTSEKKQAVKSHLQSKLTSSEYSQLKGFVGKYSYLLK